MKVYIMEGWSGSWQLLEGNEAEIRKMLAARHIRVAPSAVIMDGARLADEVRVSKKAVVGAGAVIGRGAYVGAGVYVGAGAVVDDGVHLRAGTCIGQGVSVTLLTDGKTLCYERAKDVTSR